MSDEYEGKSREAAQGRSKVKSLHRGLDVLEFILDANAPIPVSEIIRHLGIPRATAFEVTRALASRGYLHRYGPAGAYRLGRKLHKLAIGYESTSSLHKLGGRSVTALRDRTGETASLSVLDDDRVLVLLGAEGRERVVVPPPVGQLTPVNWSPAGLLLISYFEPETLRQRLPFMLKSSPTGNAPIDPEQVIALSQEGRRRGHIVAREFEHEQVTCLAAPIFDASGVCLAALGIAAYAPALDEARTRGLLAALREETLRMTAAMAD